MQFQPMSEGQCWQSYYNKIACTLHADIYTFNRLLLESLFSLKIAADENVVNCQLRYVIDNARLGVVSFKISLYGIYGQVKYQPCSLTESFVLFSISDSP